MAATAADRTRLRRMIAEATDAGGYTDAVLTDAIERYPLPDADGLWPDENDWVAVYDLNAAAAEVWGEKSAALAGSFDFAADGSSFSRSQAHSQAAKMARYYQARRGPTTLTLVSDVRVDADDE